LRPGCAQNSKRSYRVRLPPSTARWPPTPQTPTATLTYGWVAWDETFGAAVSAAERLAAQLASVRAVRIDPGLARSDHRRLIFVRLAGVPLFWRVDLDIRARSVAADDSYDEGNPTARDATGWSRPASAIENAIAAIKSVIRGRADVTSGLLSGGYERIGLAPTSEASLTELITGLAESCACLEPGPAWPAWPARCGKSLKISSARRPSHGTGRARAGSTRRRG